MATVYVISGPPGIGKSTSGVHFIAEGIDVIDPDQIVQRYKAEGFTNYKDIGNHRFHDLVRRKLFSGDDFAIELNLGFQTHYDFIKSIKDVRSDTRIDVILFYTDNSRLCHQRAEKRHENGLHYVAPEIINEMYEQTLPLFKKNFSIVSSLLAVNVTAKEDPRICLVYDEANNKIKFADLLPEWANHGLVEFLSAEVRKNISLSIKKADLSTPDEKPVKRQRKGRGL